MKLDDIVLAFRRVVPRGAAFIVAATVCSVSQGAPTDIANIPLVTTTAAAVKPNIMLLLDASGSMGRTHMPDEVETQTGTASIGYKSAQCNVLYYDPAKTYILPKQYDDTTFSVPGFSFNNARYAGFGAFYLVPDTSTRDLATDFVAWDATTLETVPGSLETPGPAYYYVYTGPEALALNTPPCTQADTKVSAPTPGGGNWTRYDVSLRPAEQMNFAIWYSYYRTRLALVKSAASLAFAPLNDSKRVGFITVQPKDLPISPSINSNRYLQLDDFALPHKQAWYSKLFSQRAKGASPAREGLARVGRYYAGKFDGINNGMDGPDPISASCQQNFTIMTTDGYWNAQTETPGGGPVDVNGAPLVTNQDGDPDCHITDPFCSHPFFDGIGASIRVTTDKSNAYSPTACGLPGWLRTREQITTATNQLLKDTSRTQERTVQYLETKQQTVATTSQTTKTVTQITQTTNQYAKDKHHSDVEKYKVKKSQDQTTMVREQFRQQTIQNVAQTTQTQQVTTTYHQYVEQWATARSQSVETTTQSLQRTFQYRAGAVQKLRHTYRIVQLVGDEEVHVPLAGACPALATCLVEEIFPALATHSGAPYGPGPDPSGTCTPSAGVDPTWVRTDCSDGPSAVAYGPVATCSPTAPSGAPSYVFYTCDVVPVAPTPVDTAFNGTCVDGTLTMDGSMVWTLCTRPAATNTSVPVASCPVEPAPTGPAWITKTCNQPPGPNNTAPTVGPPCTVGPPTVDGSLVYTTCSKVVDGPSFDSATCTAADGSAPPYNKITCTPQELSRVSVPAASCVGPTTVGTTTLTCETVAIGPYAVATAVSSCSGGPTGTPGTAGFYETTCSNPAANNHTEFVPAGSCSTTPAVGSPWISTICTEPINDTGFSDPTTCIADDGTGFPYLHVTCTKAILMPPTFVDPTTCPVGTDTVGPPGGGYIVTHCVKFPIAVGSFPPGTCPTDADPWVVVVCTDVGFLEPVTFCVPGSTGTDGVDDWVCVKSIDNVVTHPSSCLDDPGTTGAFVHVACTGPFVTSGPIFVAPAACTAGPSGPVDNVSTTTCSTVPIASGGVPAGTCTPGLDGGGIFTDCTNPVATNYTNKPVPSCIPGGPSTDGTETTTTCVKSDNTIDKAKSACVDSPASDPLWKDVQCTTTPYEASKPTDFCTVGNESGASPYERTTACNPTVPTPPVDAPSCTADFGTSPDFYHTVCGLRTIAVDEPVIACTGGTDASGLKTTCTPSAGAGLKYSFVTSTTVTTQRLSGGSPVGAPSVVGPTNGPTTDVDGICYPTPQTFTAPPPLDLVAFPTCAAWPCSVETTVADGSLNSLADVAQYYYKTDLRPAMPDNAPKAGLGIEDDNAPHQHMTTFVLGLGVSGTLNFKPDYRSPTTTSDFAGIRTGAIAWPLWPDPTVDYTDPDNWNNKKSIDDFWHTAVNGRGTFFSATDPKSVINGLGQALADVEGTVASGAPDGVSTLEPTAGNNFVFATSYKSGPWWGDVEAFTLNLATGIVDTPRKWSAKALLDAHTFASCDDRNIYLMRGGSSLVDFAWNTQKCPGGVPVGGLVDTLNAAEKDALVGPLSSNLITLSQYPFMSAAQKASMTDPANQYKTANFIRGQRFNENYIADDVDKLFRGRTNVLGDIVGSQPVYVKAPFANYGDPGYTAFKTTSPAATRTPMVYVGANDGMLHAFNAIVDPLDPMSGQEAWAVIPSAVLPNLFKLADDNYKRNAHQFYVDGSPVAGDIQVAGVWKTILVGGLNAGGKGYYALDVTTPGIAPTAALWEFKQDNAACTGAAGSLADCNLGFSFGRPVITKLTIAGVDTWVVMFTSGYNNLNVVPGDGIGYLYVVNAWTGALIYKIAATPVPPLPANTASGLAQINNYVDNVAVNNLTLRAYGGDLLGNVWRFEFGATPSAQLIGTAQDAGGVAQPITTRPELAELDGKPIIYVGSGEFLGNSDVATFQRQSVYGIVDPLTAGPVYADLRNSLRHIPFNQTGSGPGATRSSAPCDANCASTSGWVVDFPYNGVAPATEKGERVSVDMKLVLGTLVVGSIVPDAAACGIGGHSWFNYFDFATGGAVSNAPRTDPSDPSTALSGQYLADSLIVGFNILTLPPAPGDTNRRFMAEFHMSDTSHITLPPPVADPVPPGRRISWREIVK